MHPLTNFVSSVCKNKVTTWEFSTNYIKAIYEVSVFAHSLAVSISELFGYGGEREAVNRVNAIPSEDLLLQQYMQFNHKSKRRFFLQQAPTCSYFILMSILS